MGARVRTFDAARSYGQAEGFLADWLHRRDIDPGAATISSKWGYTYVGAWRLDADHHEEKSHDLQTFLRQWDASRKVLWSHLDLYQVHSLTLESPLFEDVALLEALAARKQEHGISLGVTVTGPRQRETIERVLSTAVDGVRLFDSIQATFNLLEPSVAPALEKAHGEGMGIIIKEPIANGRLAPGRTDGKTAFLEDAAQARGVSIDVLALSFVLSFPFVDCVLSGAVTRVQLESNLRALSRPWDGSDAALAA
ncbi:MAG: aldo/keto reductase, partial [Myxococcales bacterium]|nr:aldo/keto reductase [Myxococcales bacterium]